MFSYSIGQTWEMSWTNHMFYNLSSGGSLDGRFSEKLKLKIAIFSAQMCFHFQCHTPDAFQKKKVISTTDNLIKRFFLCLFQYILQTMNWTLLPLQIKFCSRGFSTSEKQQRQTLIVKRTQKLRYSFMICHMWKKLVISAAVFLILYEM